MRSISIIASILLIHLYSINAQNTFIFKGELKNKRTNEVIPWASLFIKGTSLGVPSNQKGQFEFAIGKEHYNDSLIVSALGYQRESFLIEYLSKKEFHTLTLTEKVYALDEVTIKSPDPVKIVATAIDKWVANFTNSRYEFDSFYRSTQKENGKFSRLWECAIKGFDKGGDSDKQRSVDIEYLQIRKSDDYRDGRTRWLYAFFKPQFIFTGENHTRNERIFLKKIKKAEYDYQLDSVLYLDNAAIYVIQAKSKDELKEFLFDVTFYIRAEDFTFVQMDFNAKRKLPYLRPRGIPGKMKLGFDEYKSTYVFKEIDGKMYMYYLNVFASFNWTDQSNRVIYQEENSEAIIQNIRPVPKSEKSTVKINFPQMAYGAPQGRYHPAFWQTYPLLKQLSHQKSVIGDLERGLTLEEQFLKNGPEAAKKK